MFSIPYPVTAMSIINDFNDSIRSLFEVFRPTAPTIHKADKPAEFKIPTPPSTAPARWVLSSDSVIVRGISITGAMFYLGGELKTREGSHEPSLINPLMRTSSTPDDINAFKGTPSYSSFTPYQRELYLHWLASGCRKKAPEAFLKLYFYGLEHRALLDVSNDMEALVAIRDELSRVSSIHGLLKSQAEPLIKFLNTSILNLMDIGLINKDYLSYDISHVIGLYLSHNIQVPNEVMSKFFFDYSIISQSKTISNILPTVQKAITHYLVTNKDPFFSPTFSYFDITYEAVSPILHAIPFVLTTNSMDFLSSRSNVLKINTVLVEIIESLHAYAKFIAKNPMAQNTLEANLLLPDYLYPEQFKISLANLKFEIDGYHLVDMPLSNLLSMFNGDAAVNKDKYSKLQQLLGNHKIGLVPLIYKASLSVEEVVVLYATTSVSSSNVDLALAELFIELSTWAHAKDFHVEDSELFKYLTKFDIDTNQCNQLAAISRYRKLNNKTITGLKTKLKSLTLDEKTKLATLFVSMHKSSGDITAVEIKMLESVFGLLDLDQNVLYSLLHSDKLHTNNVELDKDLIKVLQKETSSVAQLLHSVFNEPESMEELATGNTLATDSVIDTTPPVTTFKSYASLDAQASGLIEKLSEQRTWARSDLDLYASARSFMLDGILEQINEVCFDLYDEPLIDDGAILTINAEIMEKLLNG